MSDNSNSHHDDEELGAPPVKPSPIATSSPASIRWLNYARAAIVFYMLLAAALLGYYSWLLVSRQGAQELSDMWNTQAQSLNDGANAKAANIFRSIEDVANAYSAAPAADASSTLPFVTLPNLDAVSAPARTKYNVLSLAYIPFLGTEVMREQWKTYVAANQAWLQGQTILPDIWKFDANGQPVIEGVQEPYTPSWQMTPLPAKAESIVNMDYTSQTTYLQMMHWIDASQKAVLSEPVDLPTLLGPYGASVAPAEGSASVFLGPVLDQSGLVGFLSAIVPWSEFFANILADETQHATVVVESCGVNETYQITGPKVSFVGSGSLQASSVNGHVKSTPFADFAASTTASREHYCDHTLHWFPSATTMSAVQGANNDAAVLTGVTVALLALAAIVFVMYDRCVRSRKGGSRVDTVVAQILPPQVSQTLLRSSAAPTKSIDAPMVQQPLETKEALMQYVNSSSKAASGEKLLAELFPEATVFFADIQGFTAWSSIRAPDQVFTLLETIFGAFDAIAVEKGVFKVETVGDCYVAVCGLPEPNKEHAVIIAEFARECMRKVDDVIRELEMSLGPDTAELAIRVGIHSGPITAGVLRGDRARFQLFGDTVNTAARIETTGKRNRIHVSEQTASHILASGRKNWVVEREDAVEAKGKGVMKTYWLLTLRDMETASSMGDNSERGDVEEEAKEKGEKALPKSSFMQRIRAMKENRASKERRIQRLIQWNSEMLIQLLKQVVARRQMIQKRKTSQAALSAMAANIGNGHTVVEEVAEVVKLPDFDAEACAAASKSVELSETVIAQVHSYVAVIAGMYRDNPFHNFEHASHVTMSVSKLLSRIVAPAMDKSAADEAQKHAMLHDHTYGITSDPLTQFSVVLAALIHDVDHRGVPNFILNNEEKTLAAAYKSKSVAEQNSVDLAWKALLNSDYDELRASIYGDISELRRFRQLLVNSVIATDIFDKELSTARKARWEKAFSEEDKGRTAINRKATIVIEHLIQASDVAHTMQHWHVYTKWNEKLFEEMYGAYKAGRSENDPSVNWYQGEIGFLDNYVIPLAKKLKNCGVFGVASDEYLDYAQKNRREWAATGKELVESYLAKQKDGADA